PVRLLHRAARLAEGELGETRTLVLDRTRATDAEEALRAAEVTFSRFFNNTPFAIASLDGEGRILRTNAPFTRIFALSGGERGIEGLAMTEIVGEESRANLEKALAGAFANKSSVEPVDATLSGETPRSVRMYLSGVEASDTS